MQVKPHDQKVMILRGLPASGKSTYAKQLVATGFWTRVNKDALRAQLHNGKWSKGNETAIEEIRDAIILAALHHGKNVVVDDTNLALRHETRIRRLLRDFGFADVTVEIKQFDISVEECIKRDLARPNSVGEKVIRSMYNQFIRDIQKPQYLPGKEEVVICDLDGTLASFGNKNPYDRDFENDEPNQTLIEILTKLGKPVIITSGRNASYRKVTEQWLENHEVPYRELYMRRTGDNRKDCIVKREFYDCGIKNKYNVFAVFDDRKQMKTLWYELGLPVFGVGDPDANF